MKKGTLYIVATPIGNLSDITYRAVETLKSVAFILAEDTRYSRKLCSHYDIKTKLVSYRDQNHEGMIDKVFEKLNMGLDLALVSDSGTPLISDPGYRLVSELRDKGYSVSPIPGPSAVTAAISAAGLPSDRILFMGFLQKSTNRRSEALKLADESEATLVVYESPKRVLGLLEQIRDELGDDRMVSVQRELTKLHEEIVTGKIIDVYEDFKSRASIKGEFVVCVSKK